MALELSKILDNPYALKLNSLTNLVDLASTAGDVYLVAPQQPNSEVYIFDTRGDEEVNLESEITDNWVEDNTSMQDHIGLRPMQISLTGYVGELKNVPQTELKALAEQANNLYSLSAFAPKLTVQAQYIFNRAQEVYGIYKKANKTVGLLNDAFHKIPVPQEATKQAQVFGKFYELWKTRQLVSVYTPFGVFNSMAIQSLRGMQEGNSRYITEFQVNFKQVRIANSIVVQSGKKFAGRSQQTLAAKVDKGVKKPTSTLFNLEQKAFNFFNGANS